MFLSNFQGNAPDNSDIDISLMANNEVQVIINGNMPVNYQYTSEQCGAVLKSLHNIVDYMYKDELSAYIEWKADQGVFIEGIGSDIVPVKSDAIDNGHIFHDVLVLKEILMR